MKKSNAIYRDDFCVIGIKDDDSIGIYADITLDYREFSTEVAKFLADRLRRNQRGGYRLIDRLMQS